MNWLLLALAWLYFCGLVLAYENAGAGITEENRHHPAYMLMFWLSVLLWFIAIPVALLLRHTPTGN